MFLRIVILCIALLPPAACAPSPRLKVMDNHADLTTFHQKGTAVYYSRKFDGKKTASGERFDSNKLTAAHRTLPLGAMIRVTNLDNHKSVIVRINDRGPFRCRHIIDLSYAAAKAIGLSRQGVARVKLELAK
jgi:rare lipoprotein A